MENPLLLLLPIILALWVGSFFYNLQYSRRKLTWLARWLEDSLAMLGSDIGSRWLNQNTLSIEVKQGKGRIREVVIVLGSVRREIFARLLTLVRGGKDSMTIMISINPPPRPGTEIEIFKKSDPVPRPVMLGLGGMKDWEVQDYSHGAPYRIASRLDQINGLAERVITLLNDDGYDIRRISVRPTSPHLLFVFNMVKLPKTDAHDLIQLIRNLIEEVADPQPPKRTGYKLRDKRTPKEPAIRVNPMLSLGDHHVPENYGKPGDPSTN
ncbi:hypothetical protein [Candidatus Chlorohelix sp.]|uniref:hypothetical protein n=1 Tax=Candidatus Chlorohelix sp. TaxID=3139201 RepID=UPI00307168A2